MDAVAESRNPVSKQQQIDEREERDRWAEPVSQNDIFRHEQRGEGIVSPVQLTTSWIGNHTCLMLSLLKVTTTKIFSCTPTYSVNFPRKFHKVPTQVVDDRQSVLVQTGTSVLIDWLNSHIKMC